MHHTRIARLATVVLASALLVSACASGAATPEPEVTAPATAAPATAAPASAEPATEAPASAEAACNEEEIAKLQTELETNLYAIAAAATKDGTAPAPTVTNTGKAFAPGDKMTLDFMLESLDHPALVALSENAKAQAESLGATMSINGAGGDVAKQVSILESILARGSDGVLIQPANVEGLQPVLAKFKEAGIPYFFALKGMTTAEPVSQIIAPYTIEGTTVGKYVVDHFKDDPGPIKTMIISGITGDASSTARVGAFKIELLKACKFEFVAEQPGQYRRQELFEAAQGMLAANPEIDLLFGANDQAAFGGLAALKAAGIEDVTVVGIDGETEMFKLIKDGEALVTMNHLIPAIGKNAAQVMVDYLQGKPVPTYLMGPGPIVDKAVVEAGEVQPAF